MRLKDHSNKTSLSILSSEAASDPTGLAPISPMPRGAASPLRSSETRGTVPRPVRRGGPRAGQGRGEPRPPPPPPPPLESLGSGPECRRSGPVEERCPPVRVSACPRELTESGDMCSAVVMQTLAVDCFRWVVLDAGAVSERWGGVTVTQGLRGGRATQGLRTDHAD